MFQKITAVCIYFISLYLVQFCESMAKIFTILDTLKFRKPFKAKNYKILLSLRLNNTIYLL